MVVTCVCGRPFEAKRKNARYCSDRCRQRAHRNPAAVAAAAKELAKPVKAVRAGKSGASKNAASPKRRSSSKQPPAATLYDATRTELAAAGRATSPLGMAALALAHGIESPLETGSGRASMVREFRATLAAALADSQPAASPLDELRAKRDAKRRA